MSDRKNGMTLKFDRIAEGSGAEALCRLENGRAFLEWRFHLEAYLGEECRKLTLPGDGEEFLSGRESPEQLIRLRLTDSGENPVLECIQFLREEEPLQSVLPQPEIWKGTAEPCLYKLEAVLADREGNCLDRIQDFLPLRQVEHRQGSTEVLLNGEVFQKRMVRYGLPERGNPAERQRLILEDLRILQRLGANCLLPEAGDSPDRRCLGRLCDRFGFLVFSPEKTADRTDIPVFRGIRNSFFLPGGKGPSPLFYQYRAKWSREPFVYLVPESLKRLDDGKYAVCCYSNCSRVALYTDGRLFEFRTGELVFSFCEIPCTKPTIMLTAEGDGCSHSLSIHKSFTKLSPFDDIFPLE